MRLVLGSLHLSWLGGATTYLLTVAPALQRLGHEVTLYSPDAGATAGLARARGIDLVTSEDRLPARCDAVIVQDTVLSLELGALIEAPQVFISHGAELDMAAPPQVHGAVAAAVAMNDRVMARLEALAIGTERVRLRQPIDMDFFRSRGPIRERPKQVLLLGNYLRGTRRAMITDVCAELGLRHEQIGRDATTSAAPAEGIGRADIVIGYGRSLLEGMACGRAAYLLDHLGVDGWVTADSYPAMERDGFAGLSTAGELTRERLRSDLLDYDPHMGVVNESLVQARHTAWEHARQLSTLLASVAERPAARLDSGRELARLARLQWHADWRSNQLLRELQGARAAQLEQEQLARAASERAADAERDGVALARTRRWRAVQRLLAPLDAVRAQARRVRTRVVG
jgi:hypothetical protein